MIRGQKSESLFMLYFVVNLIACIWLSKVGPPWLTDGMAGVLVMSFLVLSPMVLAALYGPLLRTKEGHGKEPTPRG